VLLIYCKEIYLILHPSHSTIVSMYYGKLMSQYGFDMKSGKWDTKIRSNFLFTKNDKEMRGINSDRLRFNEAVHQYNDYIEYLLR
jgi:hypothetical protein